MNVDTAPESRQAASSPTLVKDSGLAASIVNPLMDSRWGDFVDQHPAANVFHQPGWTSSVTETFGYEPRFHVLERGNEIVAAWPTMLSRSRLTGNRLVCLPFCHRAGPLVDSTEQATLLAHALTKDASLNKVGSIETRDWPMEIEVPAEFCRTTISSTHILDLSPGIEAVTKSFSHGARYSIRRAQRNGVTVRLGDSEADVSIFYRLYLNQRRRQRLLPQPEAFVRKLYQNLVVPGNGFIVIAESSAGPLCAILLIGHGTSVVAIDSGTSSMARKALATPLAIGRSIEISSERGYRTFDFGRSAPTAVGLQEFKSYWGATGEELPYVWYGRRSGVNTGNPSPTKKRILEIYASLAPDMVFSGMSRQIYRHLA